MKDKHTNYNQKKMISFIIKDSITTAEHTDKTRNNTEDKQDIRQEHN